MKRYAVAGLSNRGIHMFIKPMYNDFGDVAQLVSVLDKDPLRFDVLKDVEPRAAKIPAYRENEFDKLFAETKPDTVIVATVDRYHADYIIAALKHNLDVITEKPMTISVEQAKAVLEAEKKSKGKVTVTFNYRYPAIHRKVKEIVLSGRLGRLTHVDLNWYLDTYHGASYFKRWNRMRDMSGGLSIHKASHHFDLLNWWIGQDPVEVFAYGALNYYGANGPMNPKKVDGRHCATCPDKTKNPYEMRWQPRHKSTSGVGPKDDHLGSVKTKRTREYSDYSIDSCIFDSQIKIEDTYVANILYDKGVMVSYSSNWSLPFEGYRLAINGTLGRLETMEYHAPHRVPWPVPQQTIDFMPLFGGSKETIHVLHGDGGHGGGDPLILQDLFCGPDPDREYELIAGARAGALSVAVGEAVWRSSVEGGKKFKIADLLGEV